MGSDDVVHMAKTAPAAKIIAVHMDAVNHATVSSDDMCRFTKKNGLKKQVAVPEEGDIVKF